MAEKYRVMCINKTDRPNPHERIANIGGVHTDGTRWKIAEVTAIAAIEAGKWAFYVHASGVSVDLVVAVHLEHKYLKTRNDGIRPDNLLALPECPQ